MAVIANFYFVEGRLLNVDFENESWIRLFEDRLGLNVNKTKRVFFVTKIVPALVFCGASIITISVKDKNITSYEIHIRDEDEFLKGINEMVEQIKVLSSNKGS